MEEHETFRAILPRDTTFGLPNGWLPWIFAPVFVAFVTKMLWLIPLVVPTYLLLKSWFKKDEYYLEHLLTFTGQADEYRA